MRRAAGVVTALIAAPALAVSALASDAQQTGVVLIVDAEPIEAEATGMPGIYVEPSVPEQFRDNGGAAGILAQGWSMLGREDLSAKAGSDEYLPRRCQPLAGTAPGAQNVLDAIAARAAEARIVIINESHEVTLHRDFSRQVIERLHPLGYTVFAAETFQNLTDEPDPVADSAALPYPRSKDGYYLREPVFGELVRTAKRLGFRLAAYEQPYVPASERPKGIDEQIAAREQSQAENLTALLATMGPDEKLVVHVGYSHAREIEARRKDGFDTSWMGARLKHMTGIDPLTIAQTKCIGSAEQVRLAQAPEANVGWFDMFVDHAVTTFEHGRSAWRFGDGHEAVDLPAEFQGASEPLIIEAFAADEPFEAVPVDRVWVEPGEDVKLALKPGRYRVRAVRPAVLPEPD